MWLCLELRTFTKVLCKVQSLRAIDSCVLSVLHKNLRGLRSVEFLLKLTKQSFQYRKLHTAKPIIALHYHSVHWNCYHENQVNL